MKSMYKELDRNAKLLNIAGLKIYFGTMLQQLTFLANNAYWEDYDQIQSQYYFKQSPHISSG